MGATYDQIQASNQAKLHEDKIAHDSRMNHLKEKGYDKPAIRFAEGPFLGVFNFIKGIRIS